MKVLTVKQPWAWAIIHGEKRIENRTWQTHYRGPLLIHAGKSKASMGKQGDLFDLPINNELVFGAIIGEAHLIDCVPFEDVAANPYASGPWCWILDNINPITPHYCKGSLGFWAPPQEVLKQLQSLQPLLCDMDQRTQIQQ